MRLPTGKMTIMRTVLASALAGFCALQGAAFAADLDYGVLRGSDYESAAAQTIDWSGFYVGGQGGWTTAAHGLGRGLQPLIADELYLTTIEKEYGVSGFLHPTPQRTNGGSFGGFAGYNVVFDGFVFGLEGDYSYSNKSAVSSSAIGRSFTTSDGVVNDVRLTGKSSTTLVDYGTLRGRVGYIMDSFLPFVTAGVAFGHTRIADTATIQASGYNQAAVNKKLGGEAADIYYYGYDSFDPANTTDGISRPKTLSRSAQKFAAGFTGGFGLDIALTSNIFLRAEYQYILFDDFGSHKINVNTVRAAAAVKF